ncbi:DEAD/DEAH box helicase [Nitrosovibrio sp. Nv4]|uniref:DEAD/DEAH box helicase n=1 Tax=Nitrosovibrio sp. Nv4 TaxID=1945880 RepID=UPI001C62D9D2|nr:DEAD/DEAH box helicase [Nitrosovibrio sp. Nv4]
MGLGKSAQAITACDHIQALKILVLCPAVARVNWIREFAKFSTRKLSIGVVESGAATTNFINGLSCSYDLLLNKKISSALLSVSWDVLILDESHYLKATDAARSKIVLGTDGLVHKARRTWLVSGTPAPNHNGELWIMCYVFGLTKLSYESFLERYCIVERVAVRTPGGHCIWRDAIKGSKNIDELKALIAPFILRRRKDQVLKDLPPILYTNVVVEAAEVDFMRWYPEVAAGVTPEAKMRQDIAEQQAAVDSIAKVAQMGTDLITALGALQDRVQKSRRYVGLQKTPAIAEIIKAELAAKAYDKIVLFAWHRDVIVDLQERLKDFKPVTLFGGTDPDRRDKNIKKFQKDPKCRVFIGNIRAAGIAITLTAAHEVGFVESSWVPADNAQAAMRVHRIGQTKPVRCRFFALANSTDEKVQQVLKRKTRDTTRLFDEDTKKEVINPFED